MTLRHFLNAAYALIVEEYVRMGMGMIEALEKTEQWREGNFKRVEEMSEEQRDRETARGLAQLNKMMAGVGR